MKFSAQEEYGLRCILQLGRLELGVTAPAARGGEDSSSPTVGDIAAIEGDALVFAPDESEAAYLAGGAPRRLQRLSGAFNSPPAPPWRATPPAFRSPRWLTAPKAASI